MGMEDFISETEAAQISGVSAATLARFVEAGYLKPEADSDGLRLFSRREVLALFSIDENTATFDTAFTSTKPPSAGISSGIPNSSSFNFNENSNSPRKPSFGVQQPTAVEQQSPAESGESTMTPAPLPEANLARMAVIEKLEREITKFKSIAEVQERIISMREAEIKQLREERDWLRSRIEHQEIKSERDQLLLLSETQTIRKLIALQENRKSFLSTALEWLGFNEQPKLPRITSVPMQSAKVTGVREGGNFTTSTAATARPKTSAAKPQDSLRRAANS